MVDDEGERGGELRSTRNYHKISVIVNCRSTAKRAHVRNRREIPPIFAKIALVTLMFSLSPRQIPTEAFGLA